ncbi:polysaccharide deacetylase family protein [Nakamurella aerolata]|uniref:Polysaccharide deacetylase family protein n=1 Tax=Nakamurella aerolata TaxID=1656892 RepID=A0A849A8V4_9ACTN|nr:polysaccharide deacetylase family protein [Nakamurella aerolata]NNG34910.1 polysaccharide deacetylase family protein [Nakamurella aerolata]
MPPTPPTVVLPPASSVSVVIPPASSSGPATSAAETTSSAPPTSGTGTAVDPGQDADLDELVPGLYPERVVENYKRTAISVSRPVADGAPALTAAAARWVQRQYDDFVTDTPPGEAPTELNIGWRVSAVAGPLIAVRFTMYLFPGASGVNVFHTIYSDEATGVATTGAGLIRPEQRADAVQLITSALRAKGFDPDVETLADDDVTTLLDGLTFAPDGSVSIVVPQGLILPLSDGSPVVPLSQQQASAYLTAAGQRFRQATRSPSEFRPGSRPATSPAAASSSPASTGSTSTGSTSTSPTSPGSRSSATRSSGVGTRTQQPSTTRPPTPTATPTPTAVQPPGTSVNCAEKRCVALTFDDGPGRYTDQLIDELTAAGAPATFFLLGPQADAYPATVRRLRSAGMVIGNHTMDHRNLVNMDAAGQRAEVTEAAAAIEAAGGGRPTLLRPPYGSYNATTRTLGDPMVMWDVDTEDWRNKDATVTARRAVDGASNGSIILMHDLHRSTVQAVPQIVSQLRAKGFTLVTVPQLYGAPLQPGQLYFSRNRVR